MRIPPFAPMVLTLFVACWGLPFSSAVAGASLDGIAPLVEEALAAGEMSGCVVLIGHGDDVVYHRAFGHRQLQPHPVPMTRDTLFDMASLTKPLATGTSVMLLAERGRLMLSAPVARYLPEFDVDGKRTITVQDLLTHQGGLIPDNSLDDYRDGIDLAWERILATTPRSAPGEAFRYSDVGFLVLQALVERVSGETLDQFAKKNIFVPLGMNDTGFLPGAKLRAAAAATEQRDDRWLCGEVHDPRAHLLGGVAGHAGLFSTAGDLARYARMMLGRGNLDGVTILQPETVRRMTRPYRVPGGFRALSWDSLSGYSSNRGRTFSPAAFGHGGFTGTSFWVDPPRGLYVIFLSSRLHPDGKGSVNHLAGEIGTLAANAVGDYQPPQVLAGIDVLQRDGFAALAGRRVGLITNHTGVARDGQSTAQLVAEAPNVELAALFSPEHGLYGRLDIREIGDSRDDGLAIPVYSLYGDHRSPTSEMLEGIDTLVFDIQDIGTRFYTYISTMGLAMEAAAAHGLRFVVLDRPNPIGRCGVDGPLLDSGRESFVGYHAIPIQHGMTIGELALLFRAERGMDLDLQVVAVEGWRRGDRFDDTGLRWVNPSPNMRSLTEAILYPGVGLLETTNLSVGRGTDAPFELIGAPWIDAEALQAALRDAKLPGVTFAVERFTPFASKYQGEPCRGISIRVTDQEAFRSLRTGWAIARTLRQLHLDSWDARAYDRLLGNRQVCDAVLAAQPIDAIEALYRDQVEAFLARRKPFLLYAPAVR